jgi:hypothetical protein
LTRNILFPFPVSLYNHFPGGALRGFLRRTIRYFLLIAVCLFGMGYELFKSADIRWPLLGGYLFVIGASVYGIRSRPEEDAEEEKAND